MEQLRFTGKIRPPIVLKLGGSVLTFKDKIEAPRMDAIERIAGEIAEAKPESLLLVHGGGSFGHPHAERFRLTGGFKAGLTQLLGLSETRRAMVKLNSLLVEALNRKGVPAFSLQTSALTLTRKGRIASFNLKVVEGFLKLGVPVLYGDAVADLEKGFTILSGDRLSAYLARRFGSPLLAFGVDVDGVYTADPKTNPKAKLFREIHVGKGFKKILGLIEGSKAIDVTGGMRSKVLEVKGYVASGGKALIFNASKPGNVARVLRGLKVEGTLIVG